MSPIAPHWAQPSHPDVQEVIINEAEFTSKSLSRVCLPPFSVFASLDFPPCTPASEPTYATVQTGRDTHLNLNSDLLYINHSCEPSLIFDVGNLNVLAGPKGLKPGDELTFFYPSTEWYMAQAFDCICGTPTCRGRISGARDMTDAQLQGIWLNGHIIQQRDEMRLERQKAAFRNGHGVHADDPTAQALRDALNHAEKVVEAARVALHSYMGDHGEGAPSGKGPIVPAVGGCIPASGNGVDRRGPTSRELSGEMGGDTACA